MCVCRGDGEGGREGGGAFVCVRELESVCGRGTVVCGVVC